MKIHTLVLGAAAMLFSGSAYATQLLTNPDFETGLFTPWTNDNSAQAGSWTIANTGCHTGTFCASIGNLDVGAEQTFSPIFTTAITAANFWVNTTNSITVALLYQTGGNDFFVLTPAAGWTNVNLMGSLRSNAPLIGIEVFGNSAAGSTTKLDDFNVSGTVPEPGAFWLLAAGLSTVGAMARKKRSSRNS